jgi:hypothetical protein
LTYSLTDTRSLAHRKRLRLALSLATIGLLIAIGFGIFLGIHSRVETSSDLTAVTVSFVLCPGTLLFAAFIDAEPWTNGFFVVWFAMALVNVALYGGVGYLIGRLFWRSD